MTTSERIYEPWLYSGGGWIVNKAGKVLADCPTKEASTAAYRLLSGEALRAVPQPTFIDIDGFVDDKGIRYIGQAQRLSNGMWVALADIAGCLCRVEVKVKFLLKEEPG